MNKLIDFLVRISNWKSLLAFLAIYISFPAYFLKNAESIINELSGRPIGVIDLTFGFNPQRTMNMMGGYSNAARAYYARTEMTTDVVYPIVYAFLFAIILTLLYKGKKYAWVSVLPFLTMLFDFAENMFIVTLLYSAPKFSNAVAFFCEIFKLLKWLGLGAIVLLIIWGLISKIFKLNKATT